MQVSRTKKQENFCVAEKFSGATPNTAGFVPQGPPTLLSRDGSAGESLGRSRPNDAAARQCRGLDRCFPVRKADFKQTLSFVTFFVKASNATAIFCCPGLSAPLVSLVTFFAKESNATAFSCLTSFPARKEVRRPLKLRRLRSAGSIADGLKFRAFPVDGFQIKGASYSPLFQRDHGPARMKVPSAVM